MSSTIERSSGKLTPPVLTVSVEALTPSDSLISVGSNATVQSAASSSRMVTVAVAVASGIVTNG